MASRVWGRRSRADVHTGLATALGSHPRIALSELLYFIGWIKAMLRAKIQHKKNTTGSITIKYKVV